MRSLRVLVAEANCSFRETLLQVLAALEGCTVVAAVAGGPEAVQVALSHQPEVVLLDVGISDRSGMNVARELRLLLPATRVVLLLSDSHPAYWRAAAECGAVWVAKDQVALALRPLLEEVRMTGSGRATDPGEGS